MGVLALFAIFHSIVDNMNYREPSVHFLLISPMNSIVVLIVCMCDKISFSLFSLPMAGHTTFQMGLHALYNDKQEEFLRFQTPTFSISLKDRSFSLTIMVFSETG